MNGIRAVFFDLDGTLVDTAPDLARVLNAVRHEEGCDALPFTDIRPVVSHGTTALLRTGFGSDLAGARLERLRGRFMALYRADIARDSVLFPGMAAILAQIEDRGLLWGVVTNKPAFLTDPLMHALGLAERAACVVSGDTTARPKPHPDGLFEACRRCAVEPSASLYVGDAERDIRAGHAAGMKTLVASFGYLDVNDRPDTWGADAIIDEPNDILAWLD